jgi:two-component system CheB/CheR fusion protein
MESREAPQADGASESGVPENERETEQRIRVYQRQLRRLASELSLAEARERREIASDLHDNIGQALAYVSQKMTALRGNAVFSGMEEEISEIVTILNQTIRYTRNLTLEISPPVLYELGLPAAIGWLADRAMRRYGLKVVSTQSGEMQEVPEDIRVFVFKAVQELIANAARHAHASRVDVHTHWGIDGFKVVVSDDGRGFDPTSFDNGLADADCFGLFSIRERLSYIGGEMSIESKPGAGSRISLSAAYTRLAEANHDQSASRG